MSNKNQDLFVQIDALLGKRSSEALSEKVAEVDDFPMLTEVIHVEDEVSLSATGPASYPTEKRQAERRSSSRRHAEVVEADDELAALEQRMQGLIKRQQDQLEALVRRIIHEELQKMKP